MSQMNPVWVLILFQSVILRLADTESTPRLSSLAHLITLNCLNHQSQLWSFADVDSLRTHPVIDQVVMCLNILQQFVLHFAPE